MSKETLKKDLKKTITLIKNNSKDAKFADTLIDKLLSVKGQLGIEPTLYHVEVNDIIREKDFESYKIIQTKNEAIFKTYGGYSVIVNPRMNVLYGFLNEVLNLEDNKEELSGEHKANLDGINQILQFIMLIPTYAFSSDDYMFKFASFAKDILQESLEEAINAELPNDDEQANQEYKESIEFAETLAKDMEKIENKNE